MSRRSLDALQRADALHEMQTMIGRQLRSLYEQAPPLSAGLSALLEQLGRSVGESNSGPSEARPVTEAGRTASGLTSAPGLASKSIDTPRAEFRRARKFN